MKDTYIIKIEVEREAFDPMTDQQWETFKSRMDEEDFNNPTSSCIEIAMEIQAVIVRDN
jgi:hypothetical protein